VNDDVLDGEYVADGAMERHCLILDGGEKDVHPFRAARQP